MKFFFSRWDIEILVKVGEQTKRHCEDKLALYIQRIVADARKRNVKPFDNYIDSLYGDDSLGKTFETTTTVQ